jgi:hypothetical protein
MFCTTLLDSDNVILQSPICFWFFSGNQVEIFFSSYLEIPLIPPLWKRNSPKNMSSSSALFLPPFQKPEIEDM